MKIGIISDTHIFAIDDEAEVLLKFLNKHFADCDLLLHAGDIVSVDFIEELSKIAPVEAVSGNMDLEKTKSKFPPKKIIEVENKIIGLIHGSGPPQGIHQRICVGFTIKPDIIVYGHTHEPFQGYENGVFYINPGSPNDTRFAFVNSVAILELNKRKIDTQIIKFDWSEIFKKYSKG